MGGSWCAGVHVSIGDELFPNPIYKWGRRREILWGTGYPGGISPSMSDLSATEGNHGEEYRFAMHNCVPRSEIR